jgi:cytochrome c-type biogenesis protein CcmF
VYINLMAFTQDGGSATIRVILEPFVPWIWVGGMIIALGAVVSAWPTSRRSPRAVGYVRPSPTPRLAPEHAFPGAAMPMSQGPSLPTQTG